MIVQCIDRDGFEDQLTNGQFYTVQGLRGNSVQLKNDKGDVCWYGKVKFRDLLAVEVDARRAA